MKVYEAVFDENAIEGVYALSVVDNPAMEDMFVALSEHPKEVEFSAIDNDKRLLLGAALIPNKKIYRNIDGNEFYMTFSEDTIEKLAHAFLKNGNQGNSSLEHEIKLEDMSVVETWIVDDPDKDKSNAYGKRYEKGTWVAMMKVSNEDIWQKAKKGEIRGFSIEALLGLTEINFKSNIVMEEKAQKSLKDDILDGIKALFTQKEEQKAVEEIEVKTEEVSEPVEETPAFDAEAFARDLKETLSVEFKSQLDEVIESKNKEIEKLKTELAKQPEVEETKDVPTYVDVELSKEGEILQLLRQHK